MSASADRATDSPTLHHYIGGQAVTPDDSEFAPVFPRRGNRPPGCRWPAPT